MVLTESLPPHAAAEYAGLRTTGLDGWMSRNPWHPRILPFLVYIACLPLITKGREWYPPTYAVFYVLQCGLVAFLLWRYRRLLPELTRCFHWLAVPIGLGLTVAWIGFGWWMAGEWQPRWAALWNGQPLGLLDEEGSGLKPHFFATFLTDWPIVAWLSLALRLVGMSLIVPLFEELFVRSAVLRSMHSARQTGIGIIQVVHDLPLVGDWLVHTEWGRRATMRAPAFTKQLRETPVGAVSRFGACASTFVFMVNHVLRDWPGAIACGLAWCWLLWWTNRPARHRKLGLGPIVWSHGVINAALWAYSVGTGDWQFL